MKTPEEIAQWVINNRYPRNEKEKISDAEMYHSLVESITNLCNMPVVNGWHLFDEQKPTIGNYIDIEWNDGTVDENIRYDGFNPTFSLLPIKWRACR
ncbi:MAG: hypothetical protein LLF95_11445 [Bacteroidales bacterium]|nr:hypothetical protein [Bacteroidales bacterium]